jgi:Holliday junction resolvase RusA-like endonuclease
MTVKNGRQILYTSTAVKDWQQSAAWQLKTVEKYKGKVAIIYMFYVKDNRRRDIDNMVCSINDALVKAEVIEDDSWQYLFIAGATAMIDKNNPRASLEIRNL